MVQQQTLIMIVPSLLMDFGTRQVPLYLGYELINNPAILVNHIHGKRVVVVTQENIALLHLAKLQQALVGFSCETIILPVGEQFKNLDEWQKILNTLIQSRHDRSVTLIALGGGVIGDITGFAAACYLRGVNYLQIPTSLIAQVDAAIGGKTAVNHPAGKNLIGLFYQPECIITDINLLQTLPDREYIAGFAEVIKYGLAFDQDFFIWLEQNVDVLIARSPAALLYAVQISTEIKAKVVLQDERDHGLRNLLNFGHTMGHALETYYVYEKLLHGEAVAIGMLLATKLSVRLQDLPIGDAQRVHRLLIAFGLPIQIDLPPLAQLLELLQRDKKVRDGKLKFILLNALGSAIQTTDVTTADLDELLEPISYA